MRAIRRIACALTVLACLPVRGAALAPPLREALAAAADDDRVPVVVLMDAFPDRRRLMDDVCDMGRARRRAHVVTTMKALARRTQAPLRTILAHEEDRGRVRDVRVLWGVNGLALEATRDVIEHAEGVASATYVEKSGAAARFRVGEAVGVDAAYHEGAYRFVQRLIADVSNVAIAAA